MTVGRARGRRAALALLDQIGAGERPVDVEALAGRLGARVVRGRLAGAQARVVSDGRRAIIRLSDRVTHAGAQRFSVAHELGHLVLTHGARALAELCTAGELRGESRSAIEAEANAFAAELLMPEPIVAQRIAEMEPDLALARAIADDRAVSLVAAAVRVVELSRARCAVVYAEDGRVVWSAASASFGAAIARGRSLDSHSLAARCARRDRFGMVPARAWLGETADDHMQVSEHAMELPASRAVVALVRIP